MTNTSAPRVAAVTGGSTGIGRAICELLLSKDYEVVSLARRVGELRHPKLHHIEVDLSDRAATADACAELVARHEVTTLVHNAGAIRQALLEDVALDDLDALQQLHVVTATQLVQAALPRMRQQQFGRVILVGTRAVLGLAGRSSYASTKAALLGLARCWALELGPAGVTVNVVAPGPVRTDMFHGVVTAGSDAEQRLAASLPMRRLGEPDDVARAVAFFANPVNGFITGQSLYVCGGASIGGLAL